MNTTLCIYHKNCADGFTAAWVVHEVYGDQADYVGGIYDTNIPDLTGLDVIMVDYSFKRDVILKMLETCESMLILDHHKTALEELGDLVHPKLTMELDMNRSGAGIAWDHYFPGRKAPKALLHVQDRDLWKFDMLGTREIQAAIFSYDYTFEVWDALMNDDTSILFDEGTAIERKHRKDTKELIATTKRHMIIGGTKVRVANIPAMFTSDAGNIMSVGKPFAACYWDTPGGRMFSLRSQEDGLDVSLIAKRYGGGGHKHAAGFRAVIGWEGEHQIVNDD